jgi:hypothetical protein
MAYIILKRVKAKTGGTPSPWHTASIQQFATEGDAAAWITAQKTPVDSIEYTAAEVPT